MLRSARSMARRWRLLIHQSQNKTQTFGLRQHVMQLLAVKSVLTDHFINELIHGRIVSKITGLNGTGMFSLQQKTAAGCRIGTRISSVRERVARAVRLSRRLMTATCGKCKNQRKNDCQEAHRMSVTMQ